MKVFVLAITVTLVLLSVAGAQNAKPIAGRTGVDALGQPLTPVGSGTNSSPDAQAPYVLVMPRLGLLLNDPKAIKPPNGNQWVQLRPPMTLNACNEPVRQPQSILINGDRGGSPRKVDITSARRCVPPRAISSGSGSVSR